VIHFYRLSCIATFLLLAGCSEEAVLKRWIQPADEAIARECVESLRQGKFDEVKHQLDPEIADSHIDETLSKMAALFPSQDPESLKVVGVNFRRGKGNSATNIKLEYEFPSKWLLANVAINRKGDAWSIVDFRLTDQPDSLENINKFTLIGKSPIQYCVLALALFTILFSLCALIVCIRTREVKMRWMWCLSIFVGVGQYAINWTTGRGTFTPISLHIPSAAATKLSSEPWIIAISLPLGAILFLNYRWNLKISGKIMPPEPVRSPTSDENTSGAT
jgi:hypothetical protein